MIISESTLNAEILWTLKVMQLHFSFRICKGISKLFAVMFPDSEISFNLKLGKTKCAYLMSYVIAPHFKSNLLKSINNSSFYSLSFDERLNNVLQSCQMTNDINFSRNLFSRISFFRNFTEKMGINFCGFSRFYLK